MEAVLLLDSTQGQLLPHPGQFVTTPRQRLLGLEQLQPGLNPLFTCSGLVIGHCFFPSCRYNRLVGPAPPMTYDIDNVSPGTDEGAMTTSTPSQTIASATGTSMTALVGKTFWPRTRTATTDIQVTLITLNATSIRISPMLEPTQQSPNSNPAQTLARQRRRNCCMTGGAPDTPRGVK